MVNEEEGLGRLFGSFIDRNRIIFFNVFSKSKCMFFDKTVDDRAGFIVWVSK